MELEFLELEYHEKLEFPKLEFPTSCRSLHISKTVVDCKIFSKTVVFGHFSPPYRLRTTSSTTPNPQVWWESILCYDNTIFFQNTVTKFSHSYNSQKILKPLIRPTLGSTKTSLRVSYLFCIDDVPVMLCYNFSEITHVVVSYLYYVHVRTWTPYFIWLTYVSLSDLVLTQRCCFLQFAAETKTSICSEHAWLDSGAEGRGGDRGQVPPWTFNFFLLICNNNNVLNWNVLFAPLHKRQKKTCLFIGNNLQLHGSELNSNSKTTVTLI